MNLPNKLTILRIIFVPFIIAATLIEFPFHYFVAGIIFAAASITDLFDGKIAREQNLITDFGKFADPLADKILIISIFICFLKLDFAGVIPIILIIFREFIVTSLRLVAASKGSVVAANMWGKVKTCIQIGAIGAIYLMQGIQDLLIQSAASICFPIFIIIGQILVWICAIVTLISGIKYVIDNKDIIKDI